MSKILAKILSHMAKNVIKKYEPMIIGITGSAGKTTTKEAIYKVAKIKYKKIAKSHANLNNEIGMPLSILGYYSAPKKWHWPFVLVYIFIKYLIYLVGVNYPKMLVLEYAADRSGDIKHLVSIAQPDIVVITNIGPAHLENFKTLDNVLEEKISLAVLSKSESIVLLNEKDEMLKSASERIFRKKYFFAGGSIDGANNAAKVIGKVLNINEEKLDKVLSEDAALPGRGKVLKGKNDNLIIDDSYNANPVSMKVGFERLEKLSQENKGLKKIACIADMKELGEKSASYHQQVFEIAKEKSDEVYTVGVEYAYSDKTRNHFNESGELANHFLTNMPQKSIILVKGSRAMKMEKVVNVLVNREIK